MEIGRPYSRLIHRLEACRPLLPEDRQHIADLPLTVANFGAGQEIVRQDDAPTRCTVVLSGILSAHKRVDRAQRQITSFFLPGDIADLSALYLPALDYGVTAVGSAVVAFVPHNALQSAMDRAPTLTEAVWRQSLIQAATFREWLATIGRRDALSRVAHLVCEIAVRLQAVGLARDLRFSIPWTQTDIADACGISNVHANRVVQKLRRRGLVEWNTQGISILDWSGLVAVGGFSAEYLALAPSLSLAPVGKPIEMRLRDAGQATPPA
ncbi:Crp/Fnr family transcriptional regulator [Rhodopseudomonas sp. B29]|uniref:Crp/Fnr family transcriptional regulator n=1 Tax=Rhodopseudomonas sp. B29 TaxID=95607 RepID=UPI00034BB3EF|nr:Crp/Fnr family transcriptional regulator [Rhodopseudomonas sp. B29]